jgi:predicted methyltransferase
LSKQLTPGDHALDATAGNGYDSAYMAKLVGHGGHVIAIDIQETAITATRARLEAASSLAQTQLITGDHAQVLTELGPQYAQTLSAITFNLGYLPGSDKSIQTTPQSTLTALRAASELLKPNGLLLVTAYRGHEGGQIEAGSVANWMQTLDPQIWTVKNHEPSVASHRIPPILWVAYKSR